jgi:hypothetical protein
MKYPLRLIQKAAESNTYGPEYFFCLHISNDAYQRCQWNHFFFPPPFDITPIPYGASVQGRNSFRKEIYFKKQNLLRRT